MNTFHHPDTSNSPAGRNEMIIMDRLGTSQNSAIAPRTRLTTKREGRRRFRTSRVRPGCRTAGTAGGVPATGVVVISR